MARGRKLIQEIVSDPDLPATSHEFRGSIARPRDTLTALRLLRICTYSGARSTAPYHRGTHVCTYTRAPFAYTRVRNLIRTFGRLHVAAAAFCFSLSSSPSPPPPLLSLIFAPLSVLHPGHPCTTNSSDPADELVKVTRGKVVPGREGVTKSGIPRKPCEQLGPRTGAGIRSLEYEAKTLRKVYKN